MKINFCPFSISAYNSYVVCISFFGPVATGPSMPRLVILIVFQGIILRGILMVAPSTTTDT